VNISFDAKVLRWWLINRFTDDDLLGLITEVLIQINPDAASVGSLYAEHRDSDKVPPE
jgi:hypothetical protein